MITAHTPGPWSTDWGFIVAPDPNGVYPDLYIAEIAREDSEEPDRVASLEVQEANARLLAAAPELLAALEYFYNISHDLPSSLEKGYLAQAQAQARAALCRARGE